MSDTRPHINSFSGWSCTPLYWRHMYYTVTCSTLLCYCSLLQSLLQVRVRVRVTLQLTVSQYVLVSSPIWDFWPEIILELEFFLRPTVDQFVWVSGLPLGSLTRIYLAFLLSFDNYVVLLSMRPLWWENGSVIYCTITSGPCQSNHTWAEVPQNSRPYLTVSSETPPAWRARFPRDHFSTCVFLL
jgi:hypothetical protein